MKRSLFISIVTALLIFLFSYTGFSKIREHAQFHFALSESPLIQSGADIISWAVPAAELLIVLLLLFSKTRVYGLYTSFCLLLLFTGYLAYMILSSAKLPCQCGGVISKMSWKGHVVFNAFFIVVNGLALKRVRSERRLRLRLRLRSEKRESERVREANE